MATPSAVKEILQALGVLSKAPAEEVAKIFADVSALDKAAQDLKPGEFKGDRWQSGEMHAHVSREEINVGPTEAATGGNAERQISHSSNVAPQRLGINEQAASLAELFAPIAAASKAQTVALGTLIEHLKSLTSVVASLSTVKAEAEGKEEDGEEDEEDSEVVEINAAKAKTLIAEAKSLLKKAKKAVGDAAMVEDDEEEKACKKKAREFRKSASIKLAKALTAAFIAGDSELRKSIRDIAAKADINVVQEDEEDEEDGEDEASKARGKEPEGNQSDTANKDGNQSAEAVKALASQVDSALKGLGVLQMSVSQMLEVASGRSAGTGKVPEFSKANTAEASRDLTNRIDSLENQGQLSSTDAFAARDIVSKMQASRLGQLDIGIVQDRIAKSSLAVQMLLKSAETAAA